MTAGGMGRPRWSTPTRCPWASSPTATAAPRLEKGCDVRSARVNEVMTRSPRSIAPGALQPATADGEHAHQPAPGAFLERRRPARRCAHHPRPRMLAEGPASWCLGRRLGACHPVFALALLARADPVWLQAHHSGSTIRRASIEQTGRTSSPRHPRGRLRRRRCAALTSSMTGTPGACPRRRHHPAAHAPPAAASAAGRHDHDHRAGAADDLAAGGESWWTSHRRSACGTSGPGQGAAASRSTSDRSRRGRTPSAHSASPVLDDPRSARTLTGQPRACDADNLFRHALNPSARISTAMPPGDPRTTRFRLALTRHRAPLLAAVTTPAPRREGRPRPAGPAYRGRPPHGGRPRQGTSSRAAWS